MRTKLRTPAGNRLVQTRVSGTNRLSNTRQWICKWLYYELYVRQYRKAGGKESSPPDELENTPLGKTGPKRFEFA
eukprot:1538557-Rhodomonas_salina.1